MLLPVHGTARIVRDIEMRYTQDGTAVASTAIVNSRAWKDKNTGEKREEACFIDVAAFGQTAEWMNQWMKKGSVLEFTGNLQQDSWVDKDGGKRSKHAIKIDRAGFGMTEKSEGGGHTPTAPNERGQVSTYQGGGQNAGQGAAAATPQQPASNIPEIDINEDEIPF